MTPAILIFVPLLALVVSSLPILPDSESEQIRLEESAQSVFCLRSSRVDDFHREARIDVASDSNGCLSFDAKTFSLVGEPIDLEGPAPFGQQMMSMVSLEDAAPIVRYHPELSTEKKGTGVLLTSASTTLILIFSCAMALFALACVGLQLFVIKYIRTQVLDSHQAWHILTRVQRAVLSYRKPRSDSVMAVAHTVLNEKPEQSNPCNPPLLSCISPPSGDLESNSEVEKFHDASHTALSFSVSSPSPNLTLLPIRQTLAPTPDQRFRPPQVYAPPVIDPGTRELPVCSSSLWIATQNPTPDHPPLIRPHTRVYHVVPAFDMALALQLIDVDAAWMVRFLMTIFGWFAVALTGGR